MNITSYLLKHNLLRLFDGGEIKVLVALFHKTLGYKKTQDRVSRSQIQKMTGLSCSKIHNAIASIEKAGIFSVGKANHNGALYRFEDPEAPRLSFLEDRLANRVEMVRRPPRGRRIDSSRPRHGRLEIEKKNKNMDLHRTATIVSISEKTETARAAVHGVDTHKRINVNKRLNAAFQIFEKLRSTKNMIATLKEIVQETDGDVERVAFAMLDIFEFYETRGAVAEYRNWPFYLKAARRLRAEDISRALAETRAFEKPISNLGAFVVARLKTIADETGVALDLKRPMEKAPLPKTSKLRKAG